MAPARRCVWLPLDAAVSLILVGLVGGWCWFALHLGCGGFVCLSRFGPRSALVLVGPGCGGFVGLIFWFAVGVGCLGGFVILVR